MTINWPTLSQFTLRKYFENIYWKDLLIHYFSMFFYLNFHNCSTNTKKVTVSNWATMWVSAAYKMTPNWYGLYMLPRSRVTENTRKLMRSLKEFTRHRWTWCQLFKPRKARSWLATLIIAIICTSGYVCQIKMTWSRLRKPMNCRAMYVYYH